ncbi:hypothetical protein [Terrarubrum flagellatum]|uniref:hypothetical protein n=1 Tax=Terrirubrum flagellatum TaxID=2895980 RepID=UPI0031454750
MSDNHRDAPQRIRRRRKIEAALDDDVKFITVQRLCKITSIGKTLAWKMIADGRVKTISLGNRRLILRSSIDALIAEAA